MRNREREADRVKIERHGERRKGLGGERGREEEKEKKQ